MIKKKRKEKNKPLKCAYMCLYESQYIKWKLSIYLYNYIHICLKI